MSTWALAAFLKPLIFAVLFAVPVYAVKRWLPPGFLKSLLLLQIHDERRYTFRASWRALLRKRS